jgi:hypothetical protein
MTSYIPRFYQQHQKITRLIEDLVQIKPASNKARARAILADLGPLLEEHHHAERVFFFDQIRDDPRIQQGGPFCTYFFYLFMNNRPLEMAEQKLKALGLKGLYLIPADLQPYFSENSPLSIPLEEHLAIQLLVQGLHEVFAEGEEGDIPPFFPEAISSAISQALNSLQDLVRLNFHKEETCLWSLSQQILDASALAELRALT